MMTLEIDHVTVTHAHLELPEVCPKCGASGEESLKPITATLSLATTDYGLIVGYECIPCREEMGDDEPWSVYGSFNEGQPSDG